MQKRGAGRPRKAREALRGARDDTPGGMSAPPVPSAPAAAERGGPRRTSAAGSCGCGCRCGRCAGCAGGGDGAAPAAEAVDADTVILAVALGVRARRALSSAWTFQPTLGQHRKQQFRSTKHCGRQGVPDQRKDAQAFVGWNLLTVAATAGGRPMCDREDAALTARLEWRATPLSGSGRRRRASRTAAAAGRRGRPSHRCRVLRQRRLRQQLAPRRRLVLALAGLAARRARLKCQDAVV